MERSTHRAHHRESLPSSMKPLECQYSTEEVRNLEGDTHQNDSTRRSLARRPEYSIRREGIVDVRYAEQGPGVVEVVFESVGVSIFRERANRSSRSAGPQRTRSALARWLSTKSSPAGSVVHLHSAWRSRSSFGASPTMSIFFFSVPPATDLGVRVERAASNSLPDGFLAHVFERGFD